MPRCAATASGAIGMCGVHRIYDFAAFCLPWVSPRFPPLLPLLPILLPLVLPLGCCILILLRSPSDQCTSERARSAKIIADETVAALATAAKVDNLDHARCW